MRGDNTNITSPAQLRDELEFLLGRVDDFEIVRGNHAPGEPVHSVPSDDDQLQAVDVIAEMVGGIPLRCDSRNLWLQVSL